MRLSRIQSTTRHEKPCGKSGGPPPKAKYYLVTDIDDGEETEEYDWYNESPVEDFGNLDID